ncbi:hypothetical protein K5L04_07085 [Flavobacterium psychrophilum]|uniref:hypothetical protein n=1 Tax=Flavobacterium psychrophilum TaxID=96345 RepID=UPI0004E7D464|nr:hypothetical protein [Flavobacterium psychrophilum]AIJ37139.1 hypothetical protein FPSM_00644 [Flavobacterium psychrophilum]AIJ37142.1 hypothetical protein FPSM_00647 [Flavobacterium psychrophilum]AIN72780.1 hypothetical protein FPG101_03020 [Flavobacterium psychrophilum FPG101]AIN75172.1 hypothetical protein FPG3_07085 [Flavobacterium psychrophilum FPG3]EKT4535406.1 hypothetical protein [Flavobacterium psychrophilum]
MRINYNLKRHKLLEVLSTQNLNVQLRKEGCLALGISYEEIYSKLNINAFELLIITSELYENKEIGYHNAYNIEGLYSETLGISAFSNGKYKKAHWNEIISKIKDVTQIVIPVLALIIAIITLTTKLENSELKNKKELNQIKASIEKLENKQNIQGLSVNNNRQNIVSKKN